METEKIRGHFSMYGIGLVVISCIGVILYLALPIFAHGSMENPLSRVYRCYLENPENPKSAACKAAVAEAGTQQFYDWNGVNRGDANGQHRAIIPDGKLCSAGKDSHRGLDLARGDWVAQSISPDANGNFEFVFVATAPHATQYFDLYVTNDGYDPSQPLNWSDLGDTPFCHITSVTLTDGRYRMTCPLPTRSGKHVIYSIWQRSDSAEAFYSCMDVQFSGGSGGTATATPSATTTVVPTATPSTTPTATPSALPSVTVTATPSATASAPTLTPTHTPTPAPPDGAACQVKYDVTSDWGSGFQVQVTLVNQSQQTISGWTVNWEFPVKQTITSLWNATYTKTGNRMNVVNASWNTNISPNGGSTSFGFVSSGRSRPRPSTFSLNGVSCSNGTATGPAQESLSLYLPFVGRDATAP